MQIITKCFVMLASNVANALFCTGRASNFGGVNVIFGRWTKITNFFQILPEFEKNGEFRPLFSPHFSSANSCKILNLEDSVLIKAYTLLPNTLLRFRYKSSPNIEHSKQLMEQDENVTMAMSSSVTYLRIDNSTVNSLCLLCPKFQLVT